MFAVLEFVDFCIIAAIVLLFAGGGAAFHALRPADRSRLRRIEAKLDQVMRHLNIETPPATAATGLSDEVRRLADEGNKIEAIRVHRDETGLGLKDAKDAVEGYMDRAR